MREITALAQESADDIVLQRWIERKREKRCPSGTQHAICLIQGGLEVRYMFQHVKMEKEINALVFHRQGQEILVPESVQAAIDERLARLDPGAQELLEEASILGERFVFDDLVALRLEPRTVRLKKNSRTLRT